MEKLPCKPYKEKSPQLLLRRNASAEKITTKLYLHWSISSWNNWGVEHWTTSYWGVPGGEHEKSGNELIQNGGNGWRISAGVPSLRGNEREATVLMKFYQGLFTNSLFINSWQSDPFLNHACWCNFLNFSFLFQFNLDSRRRYLRGSSYSLRLENMLFH